MRQLTLQEQYRRAEQSLHALLLGDSTRSRRRLKGEGPRQQASRDLRAMRRAFEEALQAERPLDEDLHTAGGGSVGQGGEAQARSLDRFATSELRRRQVTCISAVGDAITNHAVHAIKHELKLLRTRYPTPDDLRFALHRNRHI